MLEKSQLSNRGSIKNEYPSLYTDIQPFFNQNVCQDSTNASVSSKFKLPLNLGICLINPENVNDHISISNVLTSNKASAIRSGPEMSVAIMYRPFNDNKVFILHTGYIWIEREYRLSTPKTISNPTITGHSIGQISEEYSAYPISIGFGLFSSTLKSQLQAELLYGLGYIKEKSENNKFFWRHYLFYQNIV